MRVVHYEQKKEPVLLGLPETAICLWQLGGEEKAWCSSLHGVDEVTYPGEIAMVGRLIPHTVPMTGVTVIYADNSADVFAASSLYEKPVLEAIEWCAESLESMGDGGLTLSPFRFVWRFAYQKEALAIRAQLGQAGEETYYEESGSSRRPFFAWGGQYRQGISLDSIMPLYFSASYDAGQTQLAIIPFGYGDDVQFCGVGPSVPQIIQSQKQGGESTVMAPHLGDNFLNHIHFGSLIYTHGEGALRVRYRSVDVLDYDKQNEKVKILFKREG